MMTFTIQRSEEHTVSDTQIFNAAINIFKNNAGGGRDFSEFKQFISNNELDEGYPYEFVSLLANNDIDDYDMPADDIIEVANNILQYMEISDFEKEDFFDSYDEVM